MNIGVHVSLSILVASVCIPSSGIAGSYGSSISSFLHKTHYKSERQASLQPAGPEGVERGQLDVSPG